jgi:transcriptional regulator with XRE-family HTH domain
METQSPIAPLPDRVRQYRELRGYPRPRDMARALTISRATIEGIEIGSTLPSMSTLLRIADGLGITVADLFSRKAPPRPRVRR